MSTYRARLNEIEAGLGQAWAHARTRGGSRLTPTSGSCSSFKAYEKVDPIAVLPIHRRLVENQLVNASAQHYRLAARRLARMRKLAAGSDHSAQVDAFIADLRETPRRRPRLQREFEPRASAELSPPAPECRIRAGL